jgi:hypothetical protein
MGVEKMRPDPASLAVLPSLRFVPISYQSERICPNLVDLIWL